MSRLCRLKTAKHGDDGKWAHDEIVSLRKQRDDLLEANRILCEDIAERHNRIAELKQQRDELRAALERAETAMEICSDWMTEIEMPDGWTTVTDEKLRISAAIARVKSGAA